jgi:5-(carboxyamino)imidazole ribonucleotide mutase
VSEAAKPLVAIVMGSRSDWPEVMSHAARTLDDLGIANEARVMSAHRTPDAVLEYASSAEGRGIEVIIAGAGGAAHLAGVIAAKTQLPVLGVPISSALLGLDSLLSISQMPGGIPVATFSIGRAGAINAALFAAAILARKDVNVHEALRRFRETQTANILAHPDPRET